MPASRCTPVQGDAGRRPESPAVADDARGGGVVTKGLALGVGGAALAVKGGGAADAAAGRKAAAIARVAGGAKAVSRCVLRAGHFLLAGRVIGHTAAGVMGLARLGRGPRAEIGAAIAVLPAGLAHVDTPEWVALELRLVLVVLPGGDVFLVEPTRQTESGKGGQRLPAREETGQGIEAGGIHRWSLS